MESLISQTSKGRIQELVPHLDALFSKAHPGDVAGIAKDLRARISLYVSGKREPAYAGNHASAATTRGT